MPNKTRGDPVLQISGANEFFRQIESKAKTFGSSPQSRGGGGWNTVGWLGVRDVWHTVFGVWGFLDSGTDSFAWLTCHPESPERRVLSRA